MKIKMEVRGSLGRWSAKISLVGIVLLAVSCRQTAGEQQVEEWPAGDSVYVFAEPDARFALSNELDEISGLAALEDGMLAAIQDEDGELYIIDPSSGQIVDRRTFGEMGDYEAVDVAEGRLLVLRADGQVSSFENWSAASFSGESLMLDVPKRCDAEGMRYDPEGSRILISCKDEPGKGLEVEKAIFAFSLDGVKLQDDPVYIIDTRSFNVSMPDHPVNEAVRSVLSDKVDLSGFRPSELAIHPITDELYILSAVRESIVALNRSGQVTGIWMLSDELLDQPEGMAFLPNGDLFIASEVGSKKNAVLLRYNYRGSQAQGAE